MSSKFRSLHPYVAQRLISLFETLGKRHAKLIEKIRPELLDNPDQGQENEMVSVKPCNTMLSQTKAKQSFLASFQYTSLFIVFIIIICDFIIGTRSQCIRRSTPNGFRNIKFNIYTSITTK